MRFLDHVAEQIKELRRHYNSGEGISQDVLARELDVAANTISRWETGTYRPSLEDLEKLARFFGVSIISFFPQDDIEPVNNDLQGLLRTARKLDPEDLDELRKYAEFRHARRMYRGKSRPPSGRKASKRMATKHR